MTTPVRSARFADTREAEDLSAFLARLLHYDRAAAVRLQSGGTGSARPGEHGLAVFGRPPSFEVLAVRTARLDGPCTLDVTVSAGELLDRIEGGGFTVPEPVTGPPWSGVLPPRGGWRLLPGLPGVAEMRETVMAAVAEFRRLDAALPPERRVRAERDRIGREIWSRPVDGTPLPLRAVHAAHSFGFLRPGVPVALLACGAWLRLRTPFGSTALRGYGSEPLSLTPTR
jgi:hypothetical protein